MAGSAVRTRPRGYWPRSGGKRRALGPPAAHRLNRAGRSPGYLTAPSGPRPPPALAPLLVGRIRPVPMWPNPGSPREATNRQAPGQRPAGREGDGARGDLSPPLARTSLSGHLYSGQGGLPQQRRLGFGGHVRFGQGLRLRSRFPPCRFRPRAIETAALGGTAPWTSEVSARCRGRGSWGGRHGLRAGAFAALLRSLRACPRRAYSAGAGLLIWDRPSSPGDWASPGA